MVMSRVLKIGLSLLLAASMWYYFDVVVIRHQEAEATLHKTPRGNLSDLYPRWLGTRELLLHGRDPYSAEVTREIQVGFYGQALDGSHPGLPKDEERFAYPVYVAFLLAPTITIPFPVVRVLFQLLLALLTAASVPLWMRGLGLRMDRTTTAMIAILLLGSLPVVEGLHLEQLTLLECFLIAASCAAMTGGRFVMAGALLAIATIKPQIALPLAAWFGLWAFSDWKRRRGFFWGFAVTMSALFAGAHWVLPGWLGRWWTAVHAYMAYTDPRSLLEVTFGRRGGLMATLAVAMTVGLSCWLSRRSRAGSFAFNVCLLSVITADVLCKPGFPFYDETILLPAVLWLATCWETIRQRSWAGRWSYCLTGFLLTWEWVGALAMTSLSLLHWSSAALQAWQLPARAQLSVPIGVLYLLGLLAGDMWRSRASLSRSGERGGGWVPVIAREAARCTTPLND